MKKVDVLIVGGGPAGLAAAVELYRKNIKNILVVERENHLGGILKQCIHDGFGLTRFGETLSGPEYAKRFIDQVEELQIPYLTDAAVTGISGDKVVTVVSRNGLEKYQAKAVILTMISKTAFTWAPSSVIRRAMIIPMSPEPRITTSFPTMVLCRFM